ncbi:short-chain dehydrogenase/reductase [Burkholderia sp. HI2761]|uniref:oxidoreductase n=1 Tax=unclassified Burkholderia TaxID=2613784 RepID=UPI000B7A309D|nr:MULTISPECIES: oxidoreductase [unclassified Burkholderia]MPV55703.1 SDR family NAD(P)-dependent oxidoreductase [Burkholderia sp. BE24]OXJ27605.1 short-chain dehydrogenase/reductase [Burkholderia sp. HI2761]
MLKKNAVWLITGCSKGLGRALARSALESGYRVVASARDEAAVEDLVRAYGDAVAAVRLDVASQEQAETAVAAAHERFGAVDVLVNNAGYGYLAAIEEGEDSDVRAMFETNVHGTWNMIKAALPGMRKRRTGHIVNIGSVGGLTTFPGVGFYHMTKFAVEGLSETLAKEIGPLGIGVTVVEPGAFRTDFRGASMQQSGIRLEDYADTAGKARDSVLAGHGKQQGDPVRGSRAIIAALESDRPPLHLVLGGDALDLVRAKLEDLRVDLDTWEHLTRSTDYEA